MVTANASNTAKTAEINSKTDHPNTRPDHSHRSDTPAVGPLREAVPMDNPSQHQSGALLNRH